MFSDSEHNTCTRTSKPNLMNTGFLLTKPNPKDKDMCFQNKIGFEKIFKQQLGQQENSSSCACQKRPDKIFTKANFIQTKHGLAPQWGLKRTQPAQKQIRNELATLRTSPLVSATSTVLEFHP